MRISSRTMSFSWAPRSRVSSTSYFAATDVLAYDLAICLNAWCFEPDGAFNVTARAGADCGLPKHSSADRAGGGGHADPGPGRGRSGFLLTRLYDWLYTPAGALVTPKDPVEYLRKLRFHGHATGLSAYVG